MSLFCLSQVSGTKFCPQGAPATGLSLGLRKGQAVAEWCRENTQEDSIIIARKPALFYLKSSRKVLNYPYTSDAEQMIGFMAKNHVDYVIVDSFTWTATTIRYLIPTIQRYSENFKVVYAIQNPTTLVLKTSGLSSIREAGE